MNAKPATKVVINGCYGGFSLSDEAIREYLRRTGQEWTEHTDKWSFGGHPHFHVGDDRYWSSRELDRADPVLVAVVADMGAAANGDCASLEIEEVPAGTLYRISEYDGLEHIETRDAVDWSLA